MTCTTSPISVISCRTSRARLTDRPALRAITGTKAGFILVSASITEICSSVIHFSKTRYSAQSGVIL